MFCVTSVKASAALRQRRGEPRQREMRGVGLRVAHVAPPQIIEGENGLGIALEGFELESFIGSKRAQIPSPVLSRNVPRPLSAETPAPVRTKMLRFMPLCLPCGAIRARSARGVVAPAEQSGG